MVDPTLQGPGKAIFSQLLTEGVDLDDQAAVDAWMRDFNRRSFDERAAVIPGPPAGIPPMVLPDDAALAEAAVQTTAMRQVVTFLEFLGDGKALTQKGNLKLADGKALHELLGTNDRPDEVIGDRRFQTKSSTELAGVDLVYRLALKARLARKQRGRALPTARGRELRNGSTRVHHLEVWRDVVMATLDLGAIDPGRPDHYGLRWWAGTLDESVGDLIASLAVATEPVPLEAITSGAMGMLESTFDLDDLSEAQYGWLERSLPWGIDAMADRLEWLGVAEREGAVAVEPGAVRHPTGGAITLTDLGRWLARGLLLDQGVTVPVVGALAGAAASALLDAAAVWPQETLRAELDRWAADWTDPAGELAEAARAAGTIERRAVAVAALELLGPSAETALRALAEDPALRALATVALIELGLDEPDELTASDAPQMLVQALDVILHAEGPDAVAVTLTGVAQDDPGWPVEAVGELWRVEDPSTGPVLEALAGADDRRLSKAARRSLFRLRSRQGA